MTLLILIHIIKTFSNDRDDQSCWSWLIKSLKGVFNEKPRDGARQTPARWPSCGKHQEGSTIPDSLLGSGGGRQQPRQPWFNELDKEMLVCRLF